MNNRIFDIILLCALSLILGSCKKSTPVSTSTTEQKSVVPVVCVYTLGAVNVDLQRAMMDSFINQCSQPTGQLHILTIKFLLRRLYLI